MPTISLALAQDIVRRTMPIIPFSVNVIDAQGTILASGDVERIGQRHPGAQLVLARGAAVELDTQAASRLPGARAGINLPLCVRGAICGVVGLTGEPASVRQFGELVRAMAEMMLEQAQLVDELQQEKHYREQFLTQLLRRGDVSDASMQTWAARLALDLRTPRAVFVLEVLEVQAPGAPLEQILGQLQQLQAALAQRWPQQLSAVLSPGELVLYEPFAGATAEQARLRLQQLWQLVQQHLHVPATLAMGVALPGLDGAAASYASARQTARIGRARAGPDHNAGLSTFSYLELSLPVLLSGLNDGWQAGQLRQVLAPLTAHDRKSGLLMRTLATWFRHHSQPGTTAKALHIHRNTLDYRLQKIAGLTGLKLDHTDDRLLLYVALQLQ